MKAATHDHGMKKRIASALLWFYAIWYAASMVAAGLGISPALGPILGAAAAALIAGDPRHIIWTRPSSTSRSVQTGLENPT